MSLFFFLALLILPIVTSFVAIWLFKGYSYKIKTNYVGRAQYDRSQLTLVERVKKNLRFQSDSSSKNDTSNTSNLAATSYRHSISTVLIATLEYEIPDWKIKVRIGGLGTISSLMGNHMNDK